MSGPLSRWHDFLWALAAGRGGQLHPVGVLCLYCQSRELVPSGPAELGPPPRRRYLCLECNGAMDLTMARDDA